MAGSQPYSSPSEPCEGCKKLDLTPDRFQGPQDTSHSKRKIKPFGGCPFCTLVYNEVTKAGGLHVNDNTECSIEWVLDGHQPESANGETKASGPHVNDDYQAKSAETFSRRIRISWTQTDHDNGSHSKEREELYLVYTPSTVVDRESLLKNEPGSVDRDWKGDIYEWIRKCISLCNSNYPKHPNRHDDPPEERYRNDARFRELANQPWFYVVDTHSMKLTSLPVSNEQPEPYIALSYRWGSTSHHKTLQSNLNGRTQDGGLELNQMPPTIQDAIVLVRKLHLKRGAREVRYIWIDSLCVAQDETDPIHWQRNAESMDLVFGNAFFTICAADDCAAGEDPSTGLRAMKKRSAPEETEIKQGLKLLASRSPEYVIPVSDWNKRGWTFQERILSRRCLVFAGNRIYFQCRTSNYDDSGIDWSSDWRKSPLLTVDEVKRSPIQFYIKCVALYTGRDLTFPKDILKAFNGVSGLIEWYMCAPFFSGLPSSHFDFALMWRPREGKVRRPNFPSWSWSGWQHKDNPSTGTTAHYPLDVFEGTFIDLHHWLLERTWIVWYIRDRDGRRPLWRGYQPKYPERAQRVGGQWKGYDGYGGGGDTEDIKANTEIDDYGRKTRWTQHNLPRTPITLPLEPTSLPVLQFFTWKCDFYITRNDATDPGDNLARLDVLDQRKDWCGTVVVDATFVKAHDSQLCQFIALSEAMTFTKDECTSWTYPIPKNLEDFHWDLYHVMIVKRAAGERVYERRGLGKVLKAAVHGASTWEEIVLG